MLKRVGLPIVILLIGVAVFMLLFMTKAEKKTIDQPETIWRVDTVPVTFIDKAPELTLYGRVETPRKASLNAAITADIATIHILEGDMVSAGEILIELDTRDSTLLRQQRQAALDEITALIQSEQARYQRDKAVLVQEKALLALADKAVARIQQLEQTRLVTQTALDDVIADQQRQQATVTRLQHDITEHPARLARLQAQYAQAKSALQQIELDIERATISAPFSGRVAHLAVSVGDRVRPGDALLTMYDTQALEVRAQIPNRYLKTIRTVMQTSSHLTATALVDDDVLSFQLARLSGETRQDSGGVGGLFRLTSPASLPLGTFVELRMALGIAHQVISVPFNTLYGLDRVYRIKEGYLEAVTVERIGEYIDSNGHRQLLIRSAALTEGEQLISTQLPNAITGLRVEATGE